MIYLNKKELARRTAAQLKEENVRKYVSSPKQVFHISDDEGNSKDFVIKKTDKTVMFTIEDVEAILDIAVRVAEDAIKNGEPITLRGFGTLALHYRKERTTFHPSTGEPVTVEARYVPKFYSGHDLKMCAKTFEHLQKERNESYIPEPVFDDEDGDE